MNDSLTLTCPNRLCGKTVSSQFEKCPFCGTPLHKLSADEALNYFTSKEKDRQQSHREKVLNYFRIDGNVSDEQFEKLDKKYHQNIEAFNDSSLLTADAETILNRYGVAIRIIGIVIMIIYFIIAIVYFFLYGKYNEITLLLESFFSIIRGFAVYIVCIILKAFVDVFVNISITLQNINSKTGGN